MRVVASTGDGALEPAEQDILREAGDAMFFCEDIALDDDARDALARVTDLAGQLVGAERWDPELAEHVMEDLEDPAVLRSSCASATAHWRLACT